MFLISIGGPGQQGIYLGMKSILASLAGFVCVFSQLNGCSSGKIATSVPVAPTITWPAPGTITYGTALNSSQLDATANYPGAFTYSPTQGTVLNAGTQTLTATFTPSDPAQVTPSTASNSIIVSKATPAINWAAPAPVSSGTALSDTQLNATANVAGTYAYTPAAGTVMSTAGTQTLSVTFTPADTADYNAVTDSVPLTVNGSGPVYTWSNVRIVGGGYITGLYFHPTQQNLMYARTDVGGAYRWGLNDNRWVPLLDFTAKANWWQSGVEAIGLDPTNPDKLYIAVGEYTNSWDGNGAMLISNDQGNTFATVPLSFKNGSNETGRGTGERIAVDPNSPGTIYFGTRVAGLEISTNSGVAWAQATRLPTSTANGNGVIAVFPIASSGSPGSASPVIYAITAGTGMGTDPQAIYVTVNGGAATSTWEPLAGQPSFASSSTPLAPLQAKLGPDGAIYILYGDQPGPNTMTANQLWRFMPASNWISGTWTQLALPNQGLTINGSNGYGGIAVDPSHPGHLLLSTLDQYWSTGDVVYRSTDDGATWRDVSSVKTNSNSASPSLATHDASLSPYLAFGGATSSVSTGNWPTAMAIDPSNADHAIYGTGETVWTTSNLTSADPSASSTGVVHWTVGADGIEETAVLGLWAPPSGNTILLSALGDLSGFAHQNLAVSPPQQMFTNPTATPTSMDFEQNTPTTVVRATDGTSGVTPVGAISTDAGLTWTAFPSMPPGSKGGGAITIAPDGSSIVWATEDTSSVWYSANLGQTWAASAGIGAQAQVASDRVKAGVFYGFSNGTLTMSTDGGATFSVIQSGLPQGGILNVLPDAQGDLWLAGQQSGLYSNSGTKTLPALTAVAGIQDAYHLGFGKATAGAVRLTLYMDGQIAGSWGLYRSTDGGTTWLQINDPAHQWGGITVVCGDMRTFGTVYLGTEESRGIIWGTSAN